MKPIFGLITKISWFIVYSVSSPTAVAYWIHRFLKVCIYIYIYIYIYISCSCYSFIYSSFLYSLHDPRQIWLIFVSFKLILVLFMTSYYNRATLFSSRNKRKTRCSREIFLSTAKIFWRNVRAYYKMRR